MTKKVFCAFDIRQDLLLPLRGQRNVFPVDPGVTLLIGESVAKLANEILVLAGIRREDLSHGVPSSQVAHSLGAPHVTASSVALLLHYFDTASETVVRRIAADGLQSGRGQMLLFLRCFVDRGIVREVRFWDVRKVA